MQIKSISFKNLYNFTINVIQISEVTTMMSRNTARVWKLKCAQETDELVHDLHHSSPETYNVLIL